VGENLPDMTCLACVEPVARLFKRKRELFRKPLMLSNKYFQNRTNESATEGNDVKYHQESSIFLPADLWIIRFFEKKWPPLPKTE
jgi:hypothetical protein